MRLKPLSSRRVGRMLVGAALVSAGLSAEATAATQPKSALRPIDQGALQALVGKTARELHVSGAVVRLRTPQGKLTAAYGTTRLGSRIRPQPYTRFRIASITKTMTSAVILQLAQEGKLRLSDPVSKYVAGVPNGDQITIALLLKMRSGLFDYTSAPEMTPFFDNEPTKVWTPQELPAISFARPPNFPPGTDYEYSNTNYALLGLIIEKLDGRPLATAMQKRLFGPLRLKDTVLPPAARTASPSRSRAATCTAAPPP
jgi:D-alanyl-D-alanine carboxypeptidase